MKFVFVWEFERIAEDFCESSYWFELEALLYVDLALLLRCSNA